MDFAALAEIAKYTTPAVVVALGLGYWLFKSSYHSAERADKRSQALEGLLGNHMQHVEEALDRNTEGLAATTVVMDATRRVLDRAIDKI